MSKAALEQLEQYQVEIPQAAERFQNCANLYDRKLWHQLTEELEAIISEVPEVNNGDFLIRLYEGFVAGFGHRLNLLKLAKMAVQAAGQFGAPAQAVSFLERVQHQIRDAKLAREEGQPLLYLQSHIAQYKLAGGEVAECKTMNEDNHTALASLHDVDPSVSAAVHFTSSQYFKYVKDFAEFYKASLQYLAFVSSEELPKEQKLPLAVDISLAALLGDSIYNFGELLLHPIVKVLEDSPHAWLLAMLQAFHAGDMGAYDHVCTAHATTLNSMPALVQNERKLREKITILCLMELIFSLPAEQRTIPLSAIGQRTRLGLDGVEFLLMKTLSMHLIEGVIDQVDGNVQVSWVQPRVLTLPQIKGLGARLNDWMSKVNSAHLTLEDDAVLEIE
ncbi:hypothetical protein WJX73_010771 [Symbiochloris irregularis]|uniref:PCI domain-containing protein n=1 Tax=Symbiochloris irregularis TaxID=706552 RepID=A0AAW1PWQ0_9CHLO